MSIYMGGVLYSTIRAPEIKVILFAGLPVAEYR